jgi:hypothetical protein
MPTKRNGGGGGGARNPENLELQNQCILSKWLFKLINEDVRHVAGNTEKKTPHFLAGLV